MEKAQDKNAEKKFFETLFYSKQKVHADAIATSKTEETMQRKLKTQSMN